MLSSTNTGRLLYFFSVGNTSSRKMSLLSLFCFCCGGRKQACPPSLCFLSAISPWRCFFLPCILKKLWQMFEKWGSFYSDSFSVSLKIDRVFEANGLGKQQWRIQTSQSAFIYCLKDASFSLLPCSACKIAETLRWVWVNLIFSYFCFGDWFLLIYLSKSSCCLLYDDVKTWLFFLIVLNCIQTIFLLF